MIFFMVMLVSLSSLANLFCCLIFLREAYLQHKEKEFSDSLCSEYNRLIQEMQRDPEKRAYFSRSNLRLKDPKRGA